MKDTSRGRATAVPVAMATACGSGPLWRGESWWCQQVIWSLAEGKRRETCLFSPSTGTFRPRLHPAFRFWWVLCSSEGKWNLLSHTDASRVVKIIKGALSSFYPASFAVLALMLYANIGSINEGREKWLWQQEEKGPITSQLPVLFTVEIWKVLNPQQMFQLVSIFSQKLTLQHKNTWCFIVCQSFLDPFKNSSCLSNSLSVFSNSV